MNGLDDVPPVLGGRKGKTCSMSGCQNTHQRAPTMSFFRFPREIQRAKEWLAVCKRPDLVRRVDSNDININNYYVCEVHFPNQILDYSTRKILIKTAKPLSMAELNALPPSSHLPMRKAYIADLDEEYDEDTNDDINVDALIPKVIKTEGSYPFELLEPLSIQEEDSYMGDSSSKLTNGLYWTSEATRLLIKLRIERDADFESGAGRKSQIWMEICNKMREAGYDFTPEKVSKKWHNITLTYHKNNEKKHGTINWEFYDDMHILFQNKQVQNDDSNDSEILPVANDVGARKKRACNEGKLASMRETYDMDAESDDESRPLTREFKRKKFGVEDKAGITLATNGDAVCLPTPSSAPEIDESWWKNYFERKLELEREKLRKEDERHKDRMNFQKMAIMLQERVEKVKIEAMNNLTNALLRLQEST